MMPRMKICIWTVMPNHYMAAFFAVLRAQGVDLTVCYLQCVDDSRRAMNWTDPDTLPAGEYRVRSVEEAWRAIPDWKQRIHILTTYTSWLHWKVLAALVRNDVAWAHWSEASFGRVRSLPTRLAYGFAIRRYALGAFAIGNRAIRDFIRWGIPRDRIALLPYSTPPENPDVVAEEKTKAFTGDGIGFVFCGSLCRRKSTDVLLRAFDAVNQRHPHAKLILVGNDASNGLVQQELARMRNASSVLLRGPVAPEKIGSVYAAAHVCVLPSRRDGWGVALAEGARHELALIGSDVCGATEHVIEPWVNGLVVRAGNQRDLEDALSLYAADPELCHAHGAASKRLHEACSASVNAGRFRNAIMGWMQADRLKTNDIDD